MNPMVETAPKVSNQSVGDNEFSVEQPFVHMHIPKTAGTSLRRMLEAEFGPENVLLYASESEALLPASEWRLSIPNYRLAISAYEHVRKLTHAIGVGSYISKFVQTRRDQAISNANLHMTDVDTTSSKVIIGHLDSSMLKATSLDKYPLTTLVREPLERAISFYRHWQRTGGEAFGIYFKDFNPSGDDMKDALLQEGLHDFQTQWLGDLNLAKVGVVEYLPAFLESVGGAPNSSPVQANCDPSSQPPPAFDGGFMREFEAANREDYELYNRTLEAWS